MDHPSPPSVPATIAGVIDDAMREATQLSWNDPRRGQGGECGASAGARFPGFAVLKEISSGGQSMVYLGVEEATECRVAIKVFRASGTITPKHRYRFEREVEALQELHHPNIVRILHAQAGEHDEPYIVMEYVPGWNLDDYFHEHDLDVRTTMRMFAKIAGAIHASHQRGVIHRDIKPRNIRIDHNHEPRICDFGLAKLDSPPLCDDTVTETGEFVGTLYWVSPEQAEGRLQDVDVRTDVYSLGVLLYHMLTGELPFERGGSMREALTRIAATDPVPPHKHRREIDDDVETIVLTSMAKDPARRYGSAGALVEDVERWLDGRAILAKRDSWTYVVRKFAGRHWMACTLAAMLAALLVTLPLAYAWHERTQRRTSQRIADAMVSLLKTSDRFLSPPLKKTSELALIDQWIQCADQLPPGCDEAELVIREKVAHRCFWTGHFDIAWEQGVRAARLTAELSGTNSEAHAAALAKSARYALEAGRTSDAAGLSRQAMAIAQTLHASPETYAMAYDGHAWISLKVRDEIEAERAARLSLETFRTVHKNAGGLSSRLKHSAEILLDIADLRRSKGLPDQVQLADAEMLQHEGLGHARVAFHDKPLEVAHNLHSYAVLLRRMGRLDDAEKFAEEAVQIRRLWIHPGSGDAVHFCASVGSLGTLRMHQGRFAEAEALVLEAMNGLVIGDIPVFVDVRTAFVRVLVELYLRWEAAEPGKGHLEEALMWNEIAAGIATTR